MELTFIREWSSGIYSVSNETVLAKPAIGLARNKKPPRILIEIVWQSYPEPGEMPPEAAKTGTVEILEKSSSIT